MDWQDELRRLDKQLSEGEISAQDYRRMRDELLAEASAPAQGRGSLWSSARPEEAPAPDPTPAPAPASPDAEDTQIVADSTVVVEQTVVDAQQPPVDQSADETIVHASPVEETAVHEELPPAAGHPGPGEDPDRTATVAAETVAESDTGANRAPAAEADIEVAARKAARENKAPTFPPRPVDGPLPKAPPLPAPAPWTGQVLGEEVFADAKPHSNTRRAVTTLLSVLVVLAVIGGAIWFFVFRSDDAPAAEQANKPPATAKPTSQAAPKPTTSAAPPSPTNLPTNLADALGPLPGAADKNSGTISPARAGRLKLVAPQEVAAADDHDVKNVIFRGATNGDIGSALLVFTTPDGASAVDLAKAERGYLTDAGFAPGKKELRGGLPVLERRGESGTVYRVVYTTGKYTVRFGVAQRDANPVQLRKELESVADTILAVLPPS